MKNGRTLYSNNHHRMLIVGSGVVGTATGRGFAKKGHDICYVDVNSDRIKQLRSAGLKAVMAAEVNWDDVDVVMLTVPTPSLNGRVFLDHMNSAASDVGRGLATTENYVTVVVRSTIPPTTTEQHIIPILEQASGKKVGKEFGAAMNPEFLRQKTAEQDFNRPWITVLGSSDQRTAHTLNQLYAPFGGLIIHCAPTEAEMIKYVSNIYNAVKISYFNEVYQICEELGIDGHLVGAVVARSAEGMWNPLYGTRGGVPYGGACLPKDTAAFMAYCQERGWDHVMLAATLAVNERLASSRPAVESADGIDEVLASVKSQFRQSIRPRMNASRDLFSGNAVSAD